MKMEQLKVWFILLQFHPSQKLPKGQGGCGQRQVLNGNVVRIALLLRTSKRFKFSGYFSDLNCMFI